MTLTIIEEAEATIRAAIKIPGLELERVAEVCGTYSASFSYQVNPTATMGFGTLWYRTLSELLSSVLDTLEHFQPKGDIDVNIFSTDLFEWLSAEMIGHNKTVSMTIKDVFEGKVGGPRGEQTKIIVSFVERPKKLILNKTNARAFAASLGAETDRWRGATVTLGVDMVKVGGGNVPSIRVRGATPAATKTNARSNAVDVQSNGGEAVAQDDMFGDTPAAVVANGAYEE